MKEYLFEFNGKYSLVKRSAEYADGLPQYIEIPEGAEWAKLWDHGDGHQCVEFYRGENEFFSSSKKEWMRGSDQSKNMIGQPAHIIWQRHHKTKSTAAEDTKHSHYFKDVSHLDTIDVYRVLELFEVKSHAVGHAIKKLLCSGSRGAKDEAQDIQEAIDTLIRYQEMVREDVRNKS